MGIPLYQIDTFTDTLFCGNPAAICPLEKWLPDLTMQAIAAENNLSETAFFVAEDNGYRIRWFTPTTEIDLCGHATLATAYVLFQHLNYPHDTIGIHVSIRGAESDPKRRCHSIGLSVTTAPSLRHAKTYC